MSETAEAIAELTRHIGERLGGEALTGGRSLSVNTRGTQGYVGVSDRWLVIIALENDQIVVKTAPPEGGNWRNHPVQTLADVDGYFPEIARSVEAWAGRLSAHRLIPGRSYRIARDFEDHYGNEFKTGTVLTFKHLNHVPYDDGYTLHFEEGGMWLQGGSTAYGEFGLNVVPAD